MKINLKEMSIKQLEILLDDVCYDASLNEIDASETIAEEIQEEIRKRENSYDRQ